MSETLGERFEGGGTTHASLAAASSVRVRLLPLGGQERRAGLSQVEWTNDPAAASLPKKVTKKSRASFSSPFEALCSKLVV